MAAASATRNLRRWAACADAQFGGVGERRHFFVLFYETTYFPPRRGHPSAIGQWLRREPHDRQEGGDAGVGGSGASHGPAIRPQNQFEEMTILNGLQLNAQVNANSLIKVVGK